jgi:hypothetical protein
MSQLYYGWLLCEFKLFVHSAICVRCYEVATCSIQIYARCIYSLTRLLFSVITFVVPYIQVK